MFVLAAMFARLARRPSRRVCRCHVDLAMGEPGPGAGISLPRDVARIERFLREMDRRYPCNRKCHAEIRYRLVHEMNGGPIGFGRSPFKYM